MLSDHQIFYTKLNPDPFVGTKKACMKHFCCKKKRWFISKYNGLHIWETQIPPCNSLKDWYCHSIHTSSPACISLKGCQGQSMSLTTSQCPDKPRYSSVSSSHTGQTPLQMQECSRTGDMEGTVCLELSSPLFCRGVLCNCRPGYPGTPATRWVRLNPQKDLTYPCGFSTPFSNTVWRRWRERRSLWGDNWEGLLEIHTVISSPSKCQPPRARDTRLQYLLFGAGEEG